MTRRGAALEHLDDAYAAFEEDLKGSLVAGKLADVTVLSKDIMTVPVEEIPRIRPPHHRRWEGGLQRLSLKG